MLTHHKIKAEWTKAAKKETIESSSSESDKLEIVEDELPSEKIEILEQIVIYASQKSVKCHFCDKNFEKSALEEHQRTHDKTFFDCSDCDKKFRRKSSLRKHKNFFHKGKFKYQCKDCQVSFIDLTKFQLHNSTKHKNSVPQRKYKCLELNCEKSFASSEYLRRHQVTHNDEFKYACNHNACDQKFKWLTSLQVHQTIHSQTKTVVDCKICFKRFFNARTLERHQKIHKNVKFKCNLCEKVISNRKDNIRRHIRHLHADINKSEIADLIITIVDPLVAETSVIDYDERIKTPQTDENIPKPPPIVNNRVKVIQSVGNPNKHIVQSEEPETTEAKSPPEKKEVVISQIVGGTLDDLAVAKEAVTNRKISKASYSSQLPKPKYDPIQHYRKILGFSRDDDHPVTTEENTEDDEMEQEAQVFPVHWRKRTSQNFLFRR